MTHNKNIIITGASRGIGKALVEVLAQNPTHQIIALSRDTDKMRQLFSSYENVEVHRLDLNKEVATQLKKIIEPYQTIDFLINNAGYLVKKPFTELSREDLVTSYQVNVLGAMEVIQQVIPNMIEFGGHIVNISSMGGFQGSMKFAGLSAYSSSKAAICNLTELLAEEYKESKIKFNCLCLGAVQTEMLQEAFPGFEAPLSAEKMATFIANFTLEAHEWMNGKIIPVSLSNP